MAEAKENSEELREIIKNLQKQVEELKNTTKGSKKIGADRPKRKYTKSKKEKIEDLGKCHVVIIEPQKENHTGIRFKKNTFVDDGTLCKEDKAFDKKYGKKFQVQPRTKAPAVQREIKCSRCPKTLKTYTEMTYWICPKCAKG